MPDETPIEFYPPDTLELSQLTYVIIGAREKENWIFVRNKERNSWELPAGHIEAGESALEAAKRELYEETGTQKSDISAIHDYSVTIEGNTRYGRIYIAEVKYRDSLPETEIAEIVLSSKSPEPVTYPYAHWKFIDVLERHLPS